MKNRGVVAILLLSFFTLGIYTLVWFVKTKGELNERGAEIPTAWLIIVPFVNLYWLWKYFEGAEKVTSGKVSGVLMFVLDLFVTALIPMAICQDAYNKLGAAPQAAAAAPVTPDQPAAPAPSAEAAPQPPVEPQTPQA